MKIGVFSDVHGNLEALETAIAFMRAEGVTEYLCLGDIVGYGANPEECISLIRGLSATVVAGNHDYGAVGKTPIQSFNEAARKVLLWTQERLSAQSQTYLESLPVVVVQHSFRLVHASPSAPYDWEYIQAWGDIKYELSVFSDPVCLVGHSHLPFAAKKHQSRPEPQRIQEPEFSLANHATKFLINVGSVGQPRDGDPRLCVLIYDSKLNRMKLYRLDYDIDGAQRKILAAGLPEILAYRLSQGR